MRRGHILVVSLVALGLVAAACGGGAAQPTKPSATQATTGPSADRGRQLSNTQGCMGCHSTDGSPLVGPTWKGMYGREARLSNGQTAAVDDAYITESILAPDAKVVQGFPPGTMPSFQGILSQNDIQAIIAYMKTLR